MTRSTIPISNILMSSVVNDYLTQRSEISYQEGFYIGDFGSGRNAEVPLFFTKEFQHLVKYRAPKSTIYCIDMHTLRLEYMFGQFLEEGITSDARVVFAKLESMSTQASFPYEQEEYLKRNLHETTSLDNYILSEKSLPTACFHFGVMNKDLVGYMSEYYENETDMRMSFDSIRSTLHPKAPLIITQPCVMYRVNNLDILRNYGFEIVEIIDVDLKTGTHTLMDESTSIESFSRPNHYSFIVASSK